MQLFLQGCQSFRFTFCKSLDRNFCPVGDNICHCSLIYNQLFPFIPAFLTCSVFFDLRLCFILFLLDLLCHEQICAFDCFFLQIQQFSYFFFQFFYFRNGTITAQLHFGCRLINDIDCLIRKKTIVNITYRHFYCCFQSFIFDFYTMMLFIIWPKSSQYFQCFLLCWLFYRNRLKSSLQSRIFFYIFAIFFQSCCTDQLNFTSRKRRFQNVRRIQCSFCPAGTDDCMKLINKKKNSLICPYFIYHFTDTLLKFASVFASGNHSGHIKHNHSLASDRLRNHI